VYEEALPWMEGDFDAALGSLRRTLAEGRHRSDMTTVVHALFGLADLALQLGRPMEAIAPAREAVAIVRAQGYWGEAHTSFVPLAEALVRVAAPDARAVLDEASLLIERHELAVARPQLLRAQALLLARRGDHRSAVQALRTSADLARAQHALPELGRTLAVLVDVARSRGDEQLARQVAAERDEVVERIGPQAFGLSWASGRAGHAALLDDHGERDERASRLTPREQEVAALVARGLTNRQIAERLVIAEGTAGVHIDHMLNKRGFHSRTELDLWAAGHGLEVRTPS
jgi:DNA-binding NarL/FixJ family response regulator